MFKIVDASLVSQESLIKARPNIRKQIERSNQERDAREGETRPKLARWLNAGSCVFGTALIGMRRR